jgi:hypothetical protein
MIWPRCTGLRDQTACARTPSWVSHWGPAPLFNRARARRSEGPASVALLLASGCREVCPGRPSPASGPPSPSFKGWLCARILRTGLRVGPNRNGPTLRASVEGQPTGRWGHSRKSFRQGSGSHNLERVEESPTSVAHVCRPSHCNAHVCPATSVAHVCRPSHCDAHVCPATLKRRPRLSPMSVQPQVPKPWQCASTPPLLIVLYVGKGDLY